MERLTDLLMTEQRGADPSAAGTGVEDEMATGPALESVSNAEALAHRWCEVAAALAAGESKRALSVLEGPLNFDAMPHDHHVVARALRVAALHLEHSWQPVPGASFLPPEVSVVLASAAIGLEAAIAAAGDSWLRRCAQLAGQTLPALISTRTTLGHLASTQIAQREALVHGMDEPWVRRDLGPEITLVLRYFDTAGGSAAASAYHMLLAADLCARAADPDRARELRARALHRAATDSVAGDPSCEGFAELLAGDWLLGSPNAAERALPTPDRTTADPEAAAEHFIRAEAAYRRAGSGRGQAAAALRLAHAARLHGRTRECRTSLARALDLALAAGDGACVALVRTQVALEAVARGATADPAEADAIRAWGNTVGSGSWVRGLRLIALEHSSSWLGTGDLVRGRGALLFADRLSDEVEIPERADAWAELYRSAGHRQAALVFTDVRMAGLGTRIQGRPAAECFGDLLGVVSCAQLFHHHALALGDPGLLAASGVRLERALKAARGLPARDAQVTGVLKLLAADRTELPLWTALHSARRDRAAGLPDEADQHASLALAEADRLGNTYGAYAALIELRRAEEARARARRLDDGDAERTTSLQSASLWLRLNEPAKAAESARAIGRRGPAPSTPWELPGLHAELQLQLGDLDAAYAYARQAVQAYEEHRARLARDALRSASADSPVVAMLYHCAVLSQLPEESCTGLPAEAAFDWAERGRSGFLDAVRALDSATGFPGSQTAVRAWLSAGIRWSARFEEELVEIRREGADPEVRPLGLPDLASHPASERVRAAPRNGSGQQPGTVRTASGQRAGPGAQAGGRLARITVAEAELDAAEATVRRLTPTALTAVRGGKLPGAAAIAAALPPDTLLLAYHVFDEDLVGWAVSRDGVRAERRHRWAGKVTAAARRFHAGCANGDSGGPAAAQALAEWLLKPFADALAKHRRVVVVPSSRLSLLPFHVLPWDDDVLGTRHVVSYLPAASLLTRTRRPQAPWRNARALLVGAPALSPETGLLPLPGTGVEAASIARLLPGAELLVSTGATHERVITTAPKCDVLHLATHGLVDDLSPSRGRLALAGTDSLEMADLIECARAPRLLVLSACNSGRGTATAGGDVLGLTRVAMITGAQGAVVSLWPVGDSTGCLVMNRMYERLVDETAADVPTALHGAQQDIRAMSGAERKDLYGRLAEAADAPESAPAIRDSETLLSPTATDREPRHWAPFIYVGI
ncbi:CHAT domain-containing protein [Streptomyces sp. NPDC093510]|uniref:CHAT domain-containing protein n=1 Tax=Streptomyces sp. NPDC093510 TaxID=3155199 RepID=UPI00344AF8AB